MDELMTADEVAKALRVPASRVKEWGRQGRLPRVMLSSSITRYRREEVEKFAREGSAGKTAG